MNEMLALRRKTHHVLGAADAVHGWSPLERTAMKPDCWWITAKRLCRAAFKQTTRRKLRGAGSILFMKRRRRMSSTVTFNFTRGNLFRVRGRGGKKWKRKAMSVSLLSATWRLFKIKSKEALLECIPQIR